MHLVKEWQAIAAISKLRETIWKHKGNIPNYSEFEHEEIWVEFACNAQERQSYNSLKPFNVTLLRILKVSFLIYRKR